MLRVKCLRDGELPAGRRHVSRCSIRIPLLHTGDNRILLYVAIREEDIFMKNSMKEKINLQQLCRVALLIAIQVVLSRFCSFSTMGLKIGLGFLPIMLCAMLYGPVWAGVCGGVSDVIGALLFPIGTYHPGFTFCAVMMGVVYGLFLYRRNDRLIWRALGAAVLNSFVIGLFLNTLWISQLYGSKTYWGWVMYRLSEYAVQIPLNVIFAETMHRIGRLIQRRRAGAKREL